MADEDPNSAPFPVFEPRDSMVSGKVSFINRAMAKSLDFFIAFFLAALVRPPLGPLGGLIYISVCDLLFGGQSIGKRIIGLRVVDLESEGAISWKQSLVRNLPFSIPFLCSLFGPFGLLIAIILAIPLGILEVFLVFRIPSGLRLGDMMSETYVEWGPSLVRDWRAKKLKEWRKNWRLGRKSSAKSGDSEPKPEKDSSSGSSKAPSKKAKSKRKSKKTPTGPTSDGSNSSGETSP